MKTKESARMDIKRLTNKINLLIKDLDYHAYKYEQIEDRIIRLQNKLNVLKRLDENGIWTEIDKHIAEDYKIKQIIN